MNIQVEHEGNDISQYVILYEREHKICTAIGTLTLVVSDSIATTFNPWEEIDIFEEGDFKVRYYISTINWSVPNSTISLDCQDESKRLVDYFIPDQYTVEVPTYTRYWIEKFLDEVGTSYQFQTSSQGNLLSNFTSMGLMSAYEQIIVLLQLSGWYMFFDGNGVAQIGTLNTDLTDYSANLQKTDILDINLKKDDRMLRNRALVWGNYNPVTLTRVFADVEVHTPWNYDHQDVRTMVVANSNIPNNSSAFNIANLLVKEFAKITVEKHLTVTGARDITLGDVVKVHSNVYTGSGLVTTFGVSMGKEGLVTNLILDERCPRLFGYFNFGDYVYVGTYGDGVWRKHLKFVHTWENFSTGLNDLRATDLHINNGIFTSVTASGGMFYKVFDDVPWSQVDHPESLLSSQYDDLSDAPESGLFLIPFSGIKARASVVDRNLNRIIYGLDTYSGENLGDYYMMYSGMLNGSGLFSSGLTVNSGLMTDERGWIIDYRPGTGTYDSYPIHVSGEYNIRVIDIENDGKDDYVSVKHGEGIIVFGSLNYNFGEHTSQPYAATKDSRAIDVSPVSVSNINLNDGSSKRVLTNTGSENSLIAIDNPTTGERITMSVGLPLFGADFRRTKFNRVFDVIDDRWEIETDILVHSNVLTGGDEVIGIYPEPSVDKYTVFYMNTAFDSVDFFYVEWDAFTDTIGTPVSLGTVTRLAASGQFFVRTVDVNGVIYAICCNSYNPPTSGGQHLDPSEFNVQFVHINKQFRSFSNVTILDFTSPVAEAGVFDQYYYLSTNAVNIYQDNDGIKIVGWIHLGHVESDPQSTLEYLILGDGSTLQFDLIYDGNERMDVGVVDADLSHFNTQINSEKGFVGTTDGDGRGVLWDGLNLKFFTFPYPDVPFQLLAPNIYPIFGVTNLYIAKNPDTSVFYLVDANTYEIVSQITPPIGENLNNYILYKPFSNTIPGFLGRSVWFLCEDDSTVKLTPYNFSVFDTANELILSDGPQQLTKGMNFGSMFISEPNTYEVADPLAEVVYVDMGDVRNAGGGFLVLQREGENFNIVQEAAFPIRIDISLFSPLLTLQHKEATFNSFSIYDSEVFQTSITPTFSGLLTDVADYRYAYLPGSGELGITKQAVYIKNEDIWGFDAITFSGQLALYEDVAGSGLLNRIETSNFVASGQYIFVTTSGDFPQFYQKDPELETFTLYSGLPDSRATIIRLDDRI